MSSYTTTATNTYSSNNTVVVTTIANMVSGLPIVFTGTVFGNITANATYYIGNITSSNQITLSSLPGGATYALATGSGTMTATFSSAGQNVIDTVPPGDPLDVAFNKTNLNFDQIYAAGPVGSNIQIADNTIRTLNTNGNLVLAPNGIGNVVSNVNIVPNTANIRNLGSPSRRWNTIYTQYIDYKAGNITFSNINIPGNIEVGGYISAVGNVVGNYIIGDGSYLTNLSTNRIYNGNSQASIPVPNGNLAIDINGNLVAQFDTQGLSMVGNIVVGNLTISGALNNISNANTVSAQILNANTLTGNSVTISATGTNSGISLVPNGLGNITVNNHYINNLLNPTQAQDAATKAYVDSVATGLQVKTPVVVATVTGLPSYIYNQPGGAGNGVGATITANSAGNLIIDGVQISTLNERILVKDETGAAAPYNGIYTVTQVPDNATPFVLTRSTDFDVNSEMYSAYVTVQSGNINVSTGFVCTNSVAINPIVVGTSPINFVLFSSALAYTAGNGIAINGVVISTRTNTANIVYDGSGNLQVASSAAFTTPDLGSATGAQISVTGNVAAGYFIGNAAPLNLQTSSKIIYVGKNGSDSNDGSINRPFLTIKAAMAASPSGTSVHVAPGTYTEANPITIPSNVALMGDNLRNVTVIPQTPASDLFYVTNGCYVWGITIRNYTANGFSYNPATPNQNVFVSPYIQNLTSSTTTGTAVYINGNHVSSISTKAMIVGFFTIINQGGRGIHILNSGYSQLVNIYTIACDVGIQVESGGFCTLNGSDCSIGNYGLVATGTGPLQTSGTTVGSSTAGIFVVNNLANGQPHVNTVMTIAGDPNFYTIDTIVPVDAQTSTVIIQQIYTTALAAGTAVSFYTRSSIIASAHTFEYVGAGTNPATALPQYGGIPIEENEVVTAGGGIVTFTSTDQKGNFKVGKGFIINQATGTITGNDFYESLFAQMTPFILALGTTK